ncbi:MAG: adenine deaminase [Candidatus Eiseniibacteriota bacterium]|nr:MAG: adenine deaminase [Candidatus Eisenbacteria bacterium]
MSVEQLIAVAAGEQEADLVLKGGKVVNVFSGEIYESDVAIHGNRIAGVGSYSGKVHLDVQGKYVCPGLIDGHVHLESSMVSVPEFARVVVPLGTTTVVVDPHEIANVMGAEGILFMLKASKYNPMNVFVMLPSCVPATDLETAGAELKAVDLFPFLSDKWVLGLGEMMNYHGVITRSEDVMDMLKIADGRRIDGHAPGVTGLRLNAYVAGGIKSDHESVSLEEAREKLRVGLHVMLREGSASRNLLDLLPLVTERNADRFIFVTDDKHPGDLLSEGHVNHMLRLAVANGVEPALAVKMATLNAAEYYGLEKIGALAPGYYADVAVLEDFKSCRAAFVLKSGEIVAKDGVPDYELAGGYKLPLRSSVNVRALSSESFAIPAGDTAANVIGLVPGQITTEWLREKVRSKNGFVVADTTKDVVKVAVIERHHASGNIGLGLVKGFGLKQGAFASSVAHDSHNIIVVGVDEADMLCCVACIDEMQGGLCVCAGGKVVESLPLPIAGLMSMEPMTHVRDKLEKLNASLQRLGIGTTDPFTVASFLALPVIPKLKVTDQGLIDVENLRRIALFST